MFRQISVFKLGVGSSFVNKWVYCVNVHVGILVVQCPGNHCSPARLLMLENRGFTTAEQTDKLR